MTYRLVLNLLEDEPLDTGTRLDKRTTNRFCYLLWTLQSSWQIVFESRGRSIAVVQLVAISKMDSPETSMFKTNPISLKELLDDAESGKIQLPDFQRGWVWTTTVFAGCWPASPGAFP